VPLASPLMALFPFQSSAKTETQTETAEESTAQSRHLDATDEKGEEQSASGAQLNAV
jgi:hypothetical protein